ncbi:MAG TPA: hypothetical protein VLV83_26795, partial [Acidobacteriota bacterium]|nr:hypothetical protein [Acidobacteriota bacterium]
MVVVVMDGMGLVVSAETRVRLQRAALWVEERGGLQEVLVVAPSRGAADDFVRGLAQKKGGAWGVHRMTLAQLASIYATERLAEEQRAPLSPLGVEALAARAVHDCRAQEPLEYFHPVADMPGFARALARTLTELRLDEASPEKLAGSGHPGSDLARLLTCYEAELKARKLADFASMLKVAAESEQGRRYETFSFGRMPTLLLDVSLTSKLEKRFLARHCQHSRQIFATALRSDEETREALQEVLGCRAVDLEADGWKAAARGKGEEIPGGQGDGGGSFSQGFGQPGLPGPDDGSQGLAQERGDKGPQKDAGEDAERASSKPSAERDEDSDGEAESWSRQDESQEPPGRDELDSVRRWIFSPGDIPEPRERAGTVEFFSAPGEGRECVEVARRILIASSQGVPFDQMAILLRDPGIYLPLVEDALRRARIPAYFTQGAIRPDPAGRAFLALLACAAEGLSASRFAEYLSLGQVPEVDEGGGPPQREAPWVPPQQGQLSFITAEPGAIESSPEQTSPPAQAALFQFSGPGSSQGDPPDTEGSRSPSQDASRSDSRAAFSRTGSADAGRGAGAPSSASHHRTQPSDVDSSPVIAGGLRTPFQWEKLLTDAAVIGGDWKRWQRRLSGLAAEMEKRRQSLLGEDDTHAQHLSLQLERLEVLRRFALPLVRHLSELPAEAKWGVWLDYLRRLASESLAAPEAVLGVLGELQPMDEVGPVDLSEVRQVLSERLTTLRVEPPQRRYGKVFVGTVEEAAARSFRWTFIPGLAEGAFPRKALEDPLLLDDYRQSVSSDLELLPDRFERERLLLRVALGAAGDKLLISYPRMDAVQGRPRVPSFYALDVLRAAQGRLPDLKKLEQQAALAVKTYLGWPAPKDPMDAIDDAEHDLSVLETLMQDKQPSVGGARYLVEVSPHLARSLRYRYMRWSIPRWTEADGVYRPDQETARLLESQSLR